MSRLLSLRAGALALVGLVSVPITMAGATTGAVAAPAPCKVVEQGKTGSRSNLQTALTAAAPGATLVVTGLCEGSFTVSQTVTLKKGATAGTISGSGGRALHVTGGTLTVIGLRLTGDEAPDCPDWAGFLCGAVLLNDTKVVLDRVTVSESVVDGGETLSVYGGTIFNRQGATMTIKRSVIANNSALTGSAREADGPIVNEGLMTISRSKITGNQSSGGSAYGGALYTYRVTSTTTILDSTFAGNTATAIGTSEAGAIEADQGMVKIRRSLFTGNTSTGATATGGAIAAFTNVLIEDSTFTGNRAQEGGAIAVTGGASSVAIRRSTIARNTADSGGGIWQTTTSLASLGSTIVALNRADTGPDCSGTYVTAAYNLVGKGTGCDGLTDLVQHDRVGSSLHPVDPKLGTLKANGGPTKTLALLAKSPALNTAGKDCTKDVDQRGVKRPQGRACDKGAFEKQ